MSRSRSAYTISTLTIMRTPVGRISTSVYCERMYTAIPIPASHPMTVGRPINPMGMSGAPARRKHVNSVARWCFHLKIPRYINVLKSNGISMVIANMYNGDEFIVRYQCTAMLC